MCYMYIHTWVTYFCIIYIYILPCVYNYISILPRIDLNMYTWVCILTYRSLWYHIIEYLRIFSHIRTILHYMLYCRILYMHICIVEGMFQYLDNSSGLSSCFMSLWHNRTLFAWAMPAETSCWRASFEAASTRWHCVSPQDVL